MVFVRLTSARTLSNIGLEFKAITCNRIFIKRSFGCSSLNFSSRNSISSCASNVRNYRSNDGIRRIATFLNTTDSLFNGGRISLCKSNCHTRFIANSSNVAESKEKLEDEKELLRLKTIKNTKIGLIVLFATVAVGGVILIYVYGAPVRNEDGEETRDEFSNMSRPKQYLLRTWRELKLWNTLLKEPSREKLLPDPLKEPYFQPRYTLALEMTGILVHPDWTYQTGWRFKKRPAVDYFVSQVGYPAFEVVIFTAEPGFTAFPIIDNLDPNGLIMYRLFRDATKYMDGHHVKDLSKLNRDLSKVIYVDWDSKSFSLQPENALRIPKWTGNDDDTGLVDLASLLRTIATNNVEDVRPVLEYYNGFDNPLSAFRENQRKLQLEEEELQRAKKEEQSLAKGWTGRLFGFRRHSAA